MNRARGWHSSVLLALSGAAACAAPARDVVMARTTVSRGVRIPIPRDWAVVELRDSTLALIVPARTDTLRLTTSRVPLRSGATGRVAAETRPGALNCSSVYLEAQGVGILATDTAIARGSRDTLVVLARDTMVERRWVLARCRLPDTLQMIAASLAVRKPRRGHPAVTEYLRIADTVMARIQFDTGRSVQPGLR